MNKHKHNNNNVCFSFQKYQSLVLNIYHKNKIKREKLNQDFDITILILTISIINMIFFDPNLCFITSFSNTIFKDDNHKQFIFLFSPKVLKKYFKK